MPMDEQTLALRDAIEATRLGFGVTGSQVRDLVRSAHRLRVRGICIPSCFLTSAISTAADLADWQPEFVTVANFPTGDHHREDVWSEVHRAVGWGATHVDLVAPGALVVDRRWKAVSEFIRNVRLCAEDAAGQPVPLKVILETAALDAIRIRGAGGAAIEAGARWLKTSTGFHPAGGATEASVRLLRAIAPEGVGVKASGGIRTQRDALAMLRAGADRIGTSSEAAILLPSGAPDPGRKAPV